MKKLTKDEFQSLQEKFNLTTGEIKSFYDRTQNKTLFLGSTNRLVFQCQNCSSYHIFESKNEYCDNCSRKGEFKFDISNSNEYGLFCWACNFGFTSWNCLSCNSSNPIEGTYYNLAKKGGGCFIATAVYGTPYAYEVLALKEFRDTVLMKTMLGKLFVNFYYWISPPIANKIAKRNKLRTLTKYTVIAPLLKFAKYLKRKEN